MAKFSPVICCKTTSDMCDEEPTNDDMEGINTHDVEPLMEHSHPDMCVAAEEVVTASRRDKLDESAVILAQCQSESSRRTADQNIAMAVQNMSEIHTAMLDNPEIAEAVNEQLLRVKAMLPALKAKPQLEPREPANKKVAPQRCFRSTKKKNKEEKS